MSPPGNFPHLSHRARRGASSMKRTYLSCLSRRIAWGGMTMLTLIVVLTACGGSTSSTANTSASPTNGITVGASTTNTPTAASPTSIPTGTTPSPTQPGPTSVPTGHTPMPTPGRPSPTPSPTRTPIPPTPSPTPSPTPKPPTPVTVMIITNSSGSFAFSPSTLNIPVGTTVTWKNTTAAPHTVSFNGFGSGTINPGATYSFKFTRAGTFGYMCMFHPYMVATVNVK